MTSGHRDRITARGASVDPGRGQQGMEMLKMLKPKVAIPTHDNDYTVFKSPLSDFLRAVLSAALETDVQYLRHGETYHFDVHAHMWSLSQPRRAKGHV